MIGQQSRRNRPVRTAGQRNQILGVIAQPIELDMRGLMDRRLQEGARVEPHQAALTALARSQQHDPCWTRGKRIARVGVVSAEIDRELEAYNRRAARSWH